MNIPKHNKANTRSNKKRREDSEDEVDDDYDESDDDSVFDMDIHNKSSDFSNKDIEEIREKINEKNKNKRRKVNKIDDEDEFISKCDIFNLPYSWDESVINESSFNGKKNVMNCRYSNFKNQLIEKQIDLPIILALDNLLDSERNILIEKYSLMINSDQDMSTYIKIRDEIWSMIKYYQNSDMNQRKSNMEKKQILDSVIINTSELENKILNLSSNTDGLYTQGLIYQKYKKLRDMSPADSEYYKLKEWIDTSVKIPFAVNNTNVKKENLGAILADIKKELDKELYGMDKVKEELLMAINQRFINPSKSDTSIALVGPPGVGKTRIINVLAKLLNYPYEHISMGGVNDSSFLAGHSYTYEGAKPGKIVDSLIKMNCNNGILFFDEIDKVTGKEVSNQLLHITDFTQNDHFCDKYLPEIPINLSKIWFIFSLNSIKDIDPILSNRFNFIYVDGYDNNMKMTITKDHLLVKAFDKYKLSSEKYIFTDPIIKKIIDYSIKKEITLDSTLNSMSIPKTGIRELKRTIDHIFDRLSLLENISSINKIDSKLIESLSFFPANTNIKNLNKLKITEELIDTFLS